jgi:hypothetical protein
VTPVTAATASRRTALGLGAAFAVLAALVAVAFTVGRFPVTPGELVQVLWSRLTGAPHALAPSVETVVFGVRGPRVLAAGSSGRHSRPPVPPTRDCSGTRSSHRTSSA